MKRFIAVAVTAALLSLTASPSANAAVGGVIVFTGTASLPTFPCPPGCPGGSFGALGAVVASTSPSVAAGAWAGPGSGAMFSYSEPLGCATGTAAGVTGGDPLYGGSSGVFTWVRVGATAIIQLGWTSGPETGSVYVGVAAFEVTTPGPASLAVACATGAGVPVTATVAGALAAIS